MSPLEVLASKDSKLSYRSFPGLRILLAEDNEDNIFLIQTYLGPLQMEVAANGREAVEKFIAGRFDIVLMDLQMPIMDGLQATRLIREWERTHQRIATPIFACTARDVSEQAVSLKAGCNDHLVKPIFRETFFATIGKHVNAVE